MKEIKKFEEAEEKQSVLAAKINDIIDELNSHLNKIH